MKLSLNTHVSKEELVKCGSFFTPDSIVSIAVKWLKPCITNKSTIIDFGVGYGAFISRFVGTTKKLYGTDMDITSCDFVARNFPSVKVFNENSLIDIRREKYGICEDEEIVVVGNPPYNDTTSQYKKGDKGSQVMDDDVKSRDLGISFLKMYDKIKAKYICVLHPMSYLIKKTNFNSLADFKNHYRLVKAEIFSSNVFENIENGKMPFPVIIALYERDTIGAMNDFESIRNFDFDIMNSNEKFSLNKINTIDQKVHKYPTKDKNDCDLQFYTIRDINALMRNRTFLVGRCNNGIKVEIKDLYLYAWLDYFKNHFHPKAEYLFGNLSPLYTENIESDETKKELISYIMQNNSVVRRYYENNLEEVLCYYNIDKMCENYPHLEKMMGDFNALFE